MRKEIKGIYINICKYKMDTFSIHDFTPGDLVAILGEHKGKREEWYGEVVEKEDKNTLLVCLLCKTKEQGGRIWRFDGSETSAPLESITMHVVPDRPEGRLTRRSMKRAWKKMGFVVGVDDFVRREHEDLVELELGNGDSSSDSEDSDYEPEDDDSNASSDEEFDVADSDDDFVVDTHDAVEAWNDWEPRTKKEKRFKSVIDRIEEREMRKADELAFSRGRAAPEGWKVPKRKKRRT